MSNEPRYNGTELLACVAASLLEDDCSVFVGTGIPVVAGMLAQAHARSRPADPLRGGRHWTSSACLADLRERLAHLLQGLGGLQHARRDVGLSGGLCGLRLPGRRGDGLLWQRQHNRDRRLEPPKTRLPGSGGANDVGSFCWRTIYLMRQQSKRSFVNKLDFVTTPGYLTGPGAREQAGLSAGTGPYRVITQLGVYDFNAASKRMQLLALHPGVTVQQVQEASEFEFSFRTRSPSVRSRRSSNCAFCGKSTRVEW